MVLTVGSPKIMGILNITPDSFSDGGNYLQLEDAIKYGMQMESEGADIIDVGGESTRPGSKRVTASLQKQRVLPAIEGLKKELSKDTIISIDTTLTDVADAAIDAGAAMINDISAGRDDSNMFRLVAERKVPMVLMHMQGAPEDMQNEPSYSNVVGEIQDFLIERANQAKAAGVEDKNIIIDPGIGFGKSYEHNLEIIICLDCLVKTGYQVLLGASRKRFLQIMCNSNKLFDLTGATCAMTAIGVLAGVSIFRVHDTKENRQTADVINKLKN